MTTVHPEIAWCVSKVADDLPDIGVDMGYHRAAAFLWELRDANAHQPEAWRTGMTTAADACRFAADNTAEKLAQRVALPDVEFDTTALLAALDDILEQRAQVGLGKAIAAVREERDNLGEVETPVRSDYDDDDEDDYDEAVRARQEADGLEFAAQQLVAHFGVDPDPSWTAP